MSSYENYTQTSENYDKTREPVGTEISVGCFAHGPVPLDQMVVLDAGCGTGNYTQAMLHYVGQIEAVDLNLGMLEVASQKLSGPQAGGRISFHSARIDELPFEELVEILDDCGFAYRGRFAPLDATVQGEPYFDPRGPLDKEWRDGDSVWSLVSEERLKRACAQIQEQDERGELEAYLARNDARRRDIGQVTILFAFRR